MNDVSQSPNIVQVSDFYEITETLSAEELATLKRVRAFLETKVAPIINKYWAEDAFPFELLPAFRELNIGGLGPEGYGCRGGSQQPAALRELGYDAAQIDALSASDAVLAAKKSA